MINLNEVILFVCLSAAGASIVVHFVKQKAWVLGLIDIPTKRSLHSEPKPRGGGLGVCLATLVGGACAWILTPSPGWSLSALTCFYMGAVALAFVSLLDDRESVSKWARLSVHTLAAIVAILGYGYWSSISIPTYGELSLSWFGILITAIWIVGFINAFNFMDGIDGIAAGQTIVSGLGWFVIATMVNEPWIALLAAVLLGSSLGFIVHNWSPATIFMGDVGSTFIGYSLAIIPLMMSYSGGLPESMAPIIALFLVWPFVFDSSFTFIRRLVKRENVFRPHRSHMYQDLILAGYNHSTVSAMYMIMAMAGLPMAWVWLKGSGLMKLIVVATLLGLCWAWVWAWMILRRTARPIDKEAVLTQTKSMSTTTGRFAAKRLVESKSQSYTPPYIRPAAGKGVRERDQSAHIEDNP